MVMDESTLLIWLQFHRREVGKPLEWLVHGSVPLSPEERIKVAESILYELAMRVVPQDQEQQWCTRVPWDRVVGMVKRSVKPTAHSHTMDRHLSILYQLLDMDMDD